MEEWKDAVGFEGYLRVSNTGRVISLGRWINDIYGNKVWKPEREVCPDGKSKYKVVNATVNGERKSISVHRLVAMTFIPNPNNLPQVNHIDGNTRNNAVENLEWCTAKENVQHAYRTGLIDPVRIGIGVCRRNEQRRAEKERAEEEARKAAEAEKRQKEEERQRKMKEEARLKELKELERYSRERAKRLYAETKRKETEAKKAEQEAEKLKAKHGLSDEDADMMKAIMKMPIEIVKFKIPKT